METLKQAQDDAQIFGDFIASAIREMPSKEAQQNMKRALTRTLLSVQETEAAASRIAASSIIYDPDDLGDILSFE